MKESLGKKIKRYFITGVLVSAPTFVTIVVFWFVFSRLDNFLGGLLARWVTLPSGDRIPGLGILAFIIVMFLIGILTRNYIGRKFLQLTEKVFGTLPVLRTVYSAVQKLSDVMITNRQEMFKSPVLVKFPHPNAYSVGFITSRPNVPLPDGRNTVVVYVPTTPNPTSGYMLLFPEDEIYPLNISVEDAVRMIISAGVTAPDILPEKQLEKISKEESAEL
ncbi:DUF502 domain-containing protein [bacterium]|nr:DUF502 domain-containing protein [bacterium]